MEAELEATIFCQIETWGTLVTLFAKVTLVPLVQNVTLVAKKTLVPLISRPV